MDEAPRSTAPEPADPAVVAGAAEGGAPDTERAWHAVLSGEDRGLPRLRRMWGAIPVVAPLQAVCRSASTARAGVLTKVDDARARRRSNPLLCNACFGQLRKYPGGAEIEISVAVRRHPRLDGDRGANERRGVPPARPAVLSPRGEGDRSERRDHRQVPGRRDHGPVHPGDDRPDARRLGRSRRARRCSAPSADPRARRRRGPGRCRRPHGSGLRRDGRIATRSSISRRSATRSTSPPGSGRMRAPASCW